MRKLLTFILFSAGCMLGAAEVPSSERIYMNEDPWHYWWCRREKPDYQPKRPDEDWIPEKFDISEKGLIAYIDEIARGHIGDFLMCVNGQRTMYPSKVWEPVWKSLEEPDRSHKQWVKDLKGLYDNGVDPYAVWIRRCREKGVRPWISLRMNDLHTVSDRKCPDISTLWYTREDLKLKTANPWGGGFDFTKPEVRERMLALVREVLERYDPDGLELDLLRFQHYLTFGEEKRHAPLFTEFIREIRRIVEAAAAKRGHGILIAARVLAFPKESEALGLEIGRWAKEKLIDYVFPCNHWMSIEWNLPYEEWCALVGPEVKVVPGTDRNIVEDGKQRLLTYREYCRWAEGMRKRGAKEFYLYNLFGHSPRSAEWLGITRDGFR